MTFPICSVFIDTRLAGGAVVAGATVRATLSAPEMYEGVVVPDIVSAVADADGRAMLDLFPNVLGGLGSYYQISVERAGKPPLLLYAVVPMLSQCWLHQCQVSREPPRVVPRETALTPEPFPGDPPTLASLDAYKTSATSWRGIPYGPVTWTEAGGLQAQVLDVDLPTTAAPLDGFPAIFWAHPNGSTQVIDVAEVIAVKAEGLAAGFAFISAQFRHPVVNVDQGAPHTDLGLAIQHARGLAVALNLNPQAFCGLVQSRGNLAIWQSLQADLADAHALTWAGRQSSVLPWIWSYQGQTTYSTAEMATRWIQAADQAAFLAAYPNDSRWGSALASVPGAQNVPHLVMLHRDLYPTGPVPMAGFDEHFPGFGRDMRDVYAANGYTHRIATQDGISGANGFIGAVDWFRFVLAGASGLEAFAQVKARKNNATMVYQGASLAGLYTDTAGAVQAAAGTDVARVNDRQYGLGNAALGGAASGSALTQATASARPTLTLAVSGRYTLDCDGDDRLSGPALGSLPAGETLICAGSWGAASAGLDAAMAGRRTLNTGLLARRSSANVVKLLAGTGSALPSVSAANIAQDVPTVMSIVATAGGSADAWRDGSPAGQITSTFSPAAVGIAPTLGDEEPVGTPRALRGSNAFTLWAPVALSAADRQAIERWACWVAGVTFLG